MLIWELNHLQRWICQQLKSSDRAMQCLYGLKQNCHNWFFLHRKKLTTFIKRSCQIPTFTFMTFKLHNVIKKINPEQQDGLISRKTNQCLELHFFFLADADVDLVDLPFNVGRHPPSVDALSTDLAGLTNVFLHIKQNNPWGRNVTISMFGFKKRSHTQKSHQKWWTPEI